MAMLSGRLGGAVVRTRTRESLASAVVDRKANTTAATNAPKRKPRLRVIFNCTPRTRALWSSVDIEKPPSLELIASRPQQQPYSLHRLFHPMGAVAHGSVPASPPSPPPPPPRPTSSHN